MNKLTISTDLNSHGTVQYYRIKLDTNTVEDFRQEFYHTMVDHDSDGIILILYFHAKRSYLKTRKIYRK